jgi:predicted nucleotidyltransferase
MELSKEVADLLDALLAGIQERLRHNLVGVYVRGSLALGDFIAETSDIDLLAVTERPPDDEEFAALAALHDELAALPNAYARRVEIAYIDRAALRRFQPGLRHPDLGQGETLAWREHHANWILERWTLYHQGVALFGPPAPTLIDPIAPHALAAAVCARLPDWAEWARQEDDPDWRLPRSHKAYVVETMCRALYTLARGELASKAQAVAWALQTLPDPWRAIVARSQSWRTDPTVDPAIVPEVRAFVLWAASMPPNAVGRKRHGAE